MATRVIIDKATLAKFMSGKNGAVWEDINRRGNAVLREARRLCPVDEGRLRQSLAMEMNAIGNKVVSRVGTNVEYALYVHEGTAQNGTGYIYPKNGKYLVFPVKNKSGKRRRYKGGATAQWVKTTRVRGIKGQPFLRDALQAGLN